jgi:hypothetical protein
MCHLILRLNHMKSESPNYLNYLTDFIVKIKYVMQTYFVAPCFSVVIISRLG